VINESVLPEKRTVREIEGIFGRITQCKTEELWMKNKIKSIQKQPIHICLCLPSDTNQK